jgi:hypothetical protein
MTEPATAPQPPLTEVFDALAQTAADEFGQLDRPLILKENAARLLGLR